MIAYVTGLWDLSRSELQDQWKRQWSQQLEQFQKLLQLNANFYVFGPAELREFVFGQCKRTLQNTVFIERSIDWFREHETYSAIQRVRTDPVWYNSVGWLVQSTQAALELQNPVVMTKFDMLAEAAHMKSFGESKLFWVDGGIANTVSPSFIKIHETPSNYPDFFYIAFPYNASSEIHGFYAKDLYKYAGCTTDKVARGGFFGGTPELILKQFAEYDVLRKETLSKGLMGTEESLLTILMQKNHVPHGVVEGNGLIYKFFLEKPVWALFNETNHETTHAPKQEILQRIQPQVQSAPQSENEIAIQILSYESAKQLKALLETFSQDPSLLKCTLYLFQNTPKGSSQLSEQDPLIEQYRMTVLGNGTNMGIVRARVEVAKHFHASNHRQYIFFEDDMLFSKNNGLCRSGFPKKIPQLLQTMKDILVSEQLDFLKMNYSEFFGTHRDQWAWHNVPQHFREKHWPHLSEKPALQVEKIGHFDHHSISYMIGQVFLCNWPILFSKRGNEICQIETPFEQPYEQTLMSQAYQVMISGRLRAGVLLASPTEHHRFDHQDAKSRKEN